MKGHDFWQPVQIHPREQVQATGVERRQRAVLPLQDVRRPFPQLLFCPQTQEDVARRRASG